MCMLVVGEQLHTHKMQKWLKPSIMNSARAFSLLKISGNREKRNKEPSIFFFINCSLKCASPAQHRHTCAQYP